MKLSLTFESFVRPLYREYCVQTIQKTVSQIKEHFRFQKKQNIYHENAKCLKTDSKTNIQTSDRKTLDKTVKKKEHFKVHQPDRSHFQPHNTIFYQNSHKNNNKMEIQSNIYSTKEQMGHSPSLLSQSQRQKKELIQFMNKVSMNLDCQTSFYKNLLQKIEFMGLKQKYLQGLLRSLAKQKKTNYNQHLPQFDNFTSCPLSSMTFRRNQSFTDSQLPNSQLPNCQLPNCQLPNCQLPNCQLPNCQLPNYQLPNYQLPNCQLPNCQLPNYQLPIQEITLHQSSETKNRQGQKTTCFKAEYQIKNLKLISNKCQRNTTRRREKQQSQNATIYSHSMLENQPDSQNYFSQNKKIHRQNDNQTVQKSERLLREQCDLNNISQNADFLISFIKLEQQFNKIKKKSHFIEKKSHFIEKKSHFTYCQPQKNAKVQNNSKFNLLSAQ